jgi:hypothetical protein
MKLHQLAATILFGAFGWVGGTLSAEAVTLTRLSSDIEMNALISDMAFVAEGRIGDNNGTATYELNLHESDPGDPQVTDQFNWVSGVSQPFELFYDAVSNLVEFTIGDRTLTHTYSNPFSDFFLRTRATQAGSSMLLSNLQLDGISLDGESHAVAETGGLDILQISDVAGSFQLLGESTMTWEEITPVQSQLAFQIKLAEATPTVEATPTREIPEPNLVVSFVIFSLIGITYRRLSPQ